MNEKLPAPCEGCGTSGLRHGAECSECRGKGYRLIVNGRQKSAAMATPAPSAKPSAFALSVRPLCRSCRRLLATHLLRLRVLLLRHDFA
jgi:hypothetical protein